MISFFVSAIKIIFLLGFLIFIHELGHFTVAKLCKVKVNEFAIGFGPTLWKKQGKETKYALRLLPLGGFVSMEGETESSNDSRSFSNASILKRFLIVVAGATVNILFAIIVYFTLTFSEGTYISNEIDSVFDGFVAQEIGLEKGDKIIEIEQKKIKTKDDLDKSMKKSQGDNVDIKINRNGQILDYNIKPTEVKQKITGIYINDECKILSIDKDSDAEKKGIKINDEIIKIGSIEVNKDINKVLEQINQKENDTIKITVKRGKEIIEFNVVPSYASSYYLGVNLKEAPDNFINRCINARMQTGKFLFSIIDNLKELVTGNVRVNQMMGPVGISETVAKTKGITDFIYMMALISLSLGITNLLPIPALDGGKLLILIIEAIRKKPLKEKTEINIQLIGFLFLISLSLYITYYDVLRIL